MLTRPALGLVAVLFAAAPALAQSTDRPTATGTHSTTSGSPAMVPGPTGSLSGNSTTEPNSTDPAPTRTTRPTSGGTAPAPANPPSNPAGATR